MRLRRRLRLRPLCVQDEAEAAHEEAVNSFLLPQRQQAALTRPLAPQQRLPRLQLTQVAMQQEAEAVAAAEAGAQRLLLGGLLARQQLILQVAAELFY